jgi:restriction system protein
MSESLRYSTGSIGTVADITKYAQEIEGFVSGSNVNTVFTSDETIEDPSSFALEKHLEDFLVKNWSSTLLGENYNIVEENGELIGQQYSTDTGPIDILAISKDEKEILVIELKKGRASDAVVGQVLRYMGFISSEVAESNQIVKGVLLLSKMI